MVKQLCPAHADHISHYNDKYLSKMFLTEEVIAQPKYDGERMLIHFDGPNVYCTSRRISKKTGEYMRNEDKLIDLTEAYKTTEPWKYTVLDCECYSKDWSTIVGILHSLPERAKALSQINLPQFAVFDCLFYNGTDMRDMPYKTRLSFAADVVADFNYKPLHMCKEIGLFYSIVKYNSSTRMYIRNKTDVELAMTSAINNGFEGVVVKSLNRKYYDKGAYLKAKKFETVDVIVYDYIKGNGKYDNTVGALKVGYWDPEKSQVIHISKVNCGTDEERNMWFNNWQTLRGSVIEVKCQEITDKSLRHPVYVRLREDKNPFGCTKETIFKI